MCKLDNDSSDKQDVPNQSSDTQDVPSVNIRCGPLDNDAWVVGLRVGHDHPARCNRAPTRFHFVLDNSGSMGRNSVLAKDCFAELVALANGPCSLIAFESSATLVGDYFQSPTELRAAILPRQGGTNITAGLEAAVEVIKRAEMKEAESDCMRTHHVLVLLSDGAHTTGPRPEQRLPVVGAELQAAFPRLRLSVVVVGVTRNSDTSMGMVMKQSLETVSLPALEPIYFASTPTMMNEVLSQMHEGLACMQGSVVTVCAPEGCLFVRAVGDAGVRSIDLLAEPHEQALLCLGPVAPSELFVDDAAVSCLPAPTDPKDFDVELTSLALQQLVDAVRARRVAVGAEVVRPALQQLRTWVSALEARAAEQRAASSSIELHLARATPAQRLAQQKALKRATQDARELSNQLAEIEAHTSNDSASQAAFLTGARSKYGAKALIRASAHGDGGVDPATRLRDLKTDLALIAPKMKQALREDFCEKLADLSQDTRDQLRVRLVTVLANSHQSSIQALCTAGISSARLDADAALADLVDSGEAVESLLVVTGRMRQSYLSLYSAWEQLKDWCDPATDVAGCSSEYQLLMSLGMLGYPIDVQRRAATQMDPYAMDVTCVRAALADTASLSTALQSDQVVVPPEGGVAVQDLLLLVDPDVPRASRLAQSSILLKEAYTSVVLCRDLHMFTGNKMRIALHAHALLAAVQPPEPTLRKQDLEAQLQRQYLGRAFQCAQCSFGPIDHFACGDLEAHHGEDVGGAIINNACPRCSWFSEDLSDWPKWDGKVPQEAQEATASGATAKGMTAASVEIALRICYSARVLWKSGADSEAHTLCEKLSNWEESLTSADGVDHPVQLLLAMAVVDELPATALGVVPLLAMLNEVCARKARGELRQLSGTEEPAVMAAARKRVAGFLSVTTASAPQTRPLEESEPTRQAVAETCCAEYALDPESFDFKGWVRDTLQPWAPALIFVKRLRAALQTREGGWPQLSRDMEAGPKAYADLVQVLQRPAGDKESLRTFLGVEKASEAPRVLATIAAQAFLHQSSQLRRTTAVGGNLVETLGDVRDSNTLRALCVELRMATYEERVVAKVREWGQLGASLVFQRARAVDLDQYSHMCGTHVHGLDKPTFWGLWNAAKGEKAKEFLSRSNQGFVAKYGAASR